MLVARAQSSELGAQQSQFGDLQLQRVPLQAKCFQVAFAIEPYLLGSALEIHEFTAGLVKRIEQFEALIIGNPEPGVRLVLKRDVH